MLIEINGTATLDVCRNGFNICRNSTLYTYSVASIDVYLLCFLRNERITIDFDRLCACCRIILRCLFDRFLSVYLDFLSINRYILTIYLYSTILVQFNGRTSTGDKYFLRRVKCGITRTIHEDACLAWICQCNTTLRVVEFQGAATACGKALAAVALTATATSGTVEQAAHDVWSCRVAMSETQQYLIANLWNEHEAAVGAHIATLARVGRHHAYPTRVHVALLPVHAHLDTAVAIRVGIAGDSRHLRLSHGHRDTGARKRLNRRGNGLEAVAVVAALTNLVDDLGDDEVAQALPGQLADTLQEGAVEADDGAHTELGHMALGSDVVGLCGVGCLLAAHVLDELGLRVDAGKRVLARRPAVHAQRGTEGLARKLVVPVGKVGGGLVHLTVGRGMVGEHLLGTGKRLQAYLKGRQRRAVLQFHRLRRVLGTAEDERGAVIVHPLLIQEGKTAEKLD